MQSAPTATRSRRFRRADGVNPALYEKLAYHPLRDFVPVAMMIKFPSGDCTPSVPRRNVAELIGLARPNQER